MTTSQYQYAVSFGQAARDASERCEEQAAWDSESRQSPYSTVADPEDDTYCEGCDSDVDYSDPSNPHGTCRCDD